MDGQLHILLGKMSATRGVRRRYSSLPFYLVLLSVFSLSVLALCTTYLNGDSTSLRAGTWAKRGVLALEAEPQECRFVHDAEDQCRFVRTNCGEHEIGLLSYLQLYYCNLAKAKAVAFIILALWLSLLFSTIGIAASDFLCINLSTIANILGMSESLTGVTFLAFGNGSPDVFSTFAAMSSNSGSLAVGELLGAACFITAAVAGSMALVRPFRVARRSFVRDVTFFIVAASFSLVFLADGKLHVWECMAMIGFYAFYVVTVVTWHWYLGRQRRKRERDISARAQFHIPENQELEIDEEPEDDDPVAGASRPLLLGASTEDFSALERAEVPAWKVENVEEDDETRDRYLAELQGNMRLSRAPAGQRGSNMGPIRPSLVGALEFRSVLSSLRGSRNFNSGSIHLRRYSDEPRFPANNEHEGVFDRRSTRARAVSAHEPHGFEEGETNDGTPRIDFMVTGANTREHQDHANTPQNGQADMLFASPTSSGYPSRSASPVPRGRSRSPNLLAPPEDTFRAPNYELGADGSSGDGGSSVVSPRDTAAKSPARSMSPIAPFPPYHDDAANFRSAIPSVRLSPSISGASAHEHDNVAGHHPEPLPPRWWPSHLLPPPAVLVAILFPTMTGWRDGTLWDKFLGIAAAPSVFILTVTLPVVEPAKAESETPTEVDPTSPPLQPSDYRDSPNGDGPFPERYQDAPGVSSPSNDPASARTNTSEEWRQHLADMASIRRQRQDSELPCAPTAANGDYKPSSKVWNRWLLAVQLVTAPLFITWVAWANFDPDMRLLHLLFSWLSSLLVSCVLVAALFYTTKSTSTQAPATARPLLAFLGFIVAIAWISTIATEVVSLLKAFGVILSISDSLLGLTVFAVGNSLGDLVADVTVARLGYPVMALSACFGGPMLNILLGIGVGGLYMTLHGSQHPSDSLDSILPSSISTTRQAYHLDINRTLLISGITLVVTLAGLLVVVPLNKWRMDRKVGLGLVVLWCVSTVCNVVVELVS